MSSELGFRGFPEIPCIKTKIFITILLLASMFLYSLKILCLNVIFSTIWSCQVASEGPKESDAVTAEHGVLQCGAHPGADSSSNARIHRRHSTHSGCAGGPAAFATLAPEAA